jgi:hypothetical protein
MQDEPDIQQEHDWYSKEFKAKADVDYGIVLKYAENLYREALVTFASLDKKAEWLYGLTIAAIASVYLLSPEKKISTLISWGLPSLVFSGLAFISIIRTKSPGERPASMSIRGAIQCAESSEDPSAIISANLHCATKEILKVNAWKANQIANASRALIFAFFLAPLVLFAPSPEKFTFFGVADIPPATAPFGVEPMVQPLELQQASVELRGRVVREYGTVH